MLRLVLGNGQATPNDILTLAIRLGEAAGLHNLSLFCIRASRSPNSASRYVHLADVSGRPWLIRVSNHRMPAKNWNAVPHLDLVSLDGKSGLNEGIAYLAKIGAGNAIWFDPRDRDERAAIRLRKKGGRR